MTRAPRSSARFEPQGRTGLSSQQVRFALLVSSGPCGCRSGIRTATATSWSQPPGVPDARRARLGPELRRRRLTPRPHVHAVDGSCHKAPAAALTRQAHGAPAPRTSRAEATHVTRWPDAHGERVTPGFERGACQRRARRSSQRRGSRSVPAPGRCARDARPPPRRPRHDVSVSTTGWPMIDKTDPVGV